MSDLALPEYDGKRERRLGTSVVRMEKPWGYFEQYAHNLSCTVKIITVDPGAALSRQYHHHRDELWVILDAGAEIELGEAVLRPSPSEKLFIPRGTLHRLSCVGDYPTRILEVSFGFFDEDDIVRTEDVYGRAGPAKNGNEAASEGWMVVDGRLRRIVGI